MVSKGSRTMMRYLSCLGDKKIARSHKSVGDFSMWKDDSLVIMVARYALERTHDTAVSNARCQLTDVEPDCCSGVVDASTATRVLGTPQSIGGSC